MPRSSRSPSNHRVAVLVAAALLATPLVASAVQLAWSATRLSFVSLGEGRTASKGTAVFRNGDQADTTSKCTVGPLDAKGWVTLKCDSEYRFADGAVILLTTDSAYNDKTMDAKGSAVFTGGTGRFEGISGKATGSGLMGKMEWTGSYSLPTRKK